MKRIFAIGAVLAATPVIAQETDQATLDRINALLAGMQCEVDSVHIEPEDAGWELDDVFCADGQHDIKLDADLNVTERRKE